MLPWEKIDEAPVPGGDGLPELVRRGDEFAIRIDRIQLMTSREHGTEYELARLGCEGLGESSRVLVGGLGMGFTLAAALQALPASASVVVAELIPAVVRWNEGPLAPLAGEPMSDARVEVFEGDVADLIRKSTGTFDAILLDVDNGPEGLTRDSNEWLYTNEGLRSAALALRPGGALAVWSSSHDERFTRRLSSLGLKVKAHQVRARGKRGARATVWTARLR